MKNTLAAVMIAAILWNCPAIAGERSFKSMADVKAELSKNFPNNSIINIVAFGDSVPAGYGVTPKVQQRDAYPRLLADFLSDRYPSAIFNVITSAVGGENSREGLKRFHDALAMKPAVVMIDYGLNDRLLPPAESVSNTQRMIKMAHDVGAVAILVTPNPDLTGTPPGAFSSLAEQIEIIRKVAADNGAELADAALIFNNYEGDLTSLMATNGHPNAGGHKLIASSITPLFE